jgi:CHAT domain-containing protein
MLSLARAFFYAGAQALLATLWAVEDRALPELFARFYRAWNEGADAARALQRAQVEMIRAGYRPFDWAGAVLIGQA